MPSPQAQSLLSSGTTLMGNRLAASSNSVQMKMHRSVAESKGSNNGKMCTLQVAPCLEPWLDFLLVRNTALKKESIYIYTYIYTHIHTYFSAHVSPVFLITYF